MNCKECLERMRPDDPRIKSGRYHLSGCDYCAYYMSPEYRLEKLEEEIPNLGKIIPKDEQWNSKQWDTVKQLQGLVRYLDSKVTEMRASKKKGFVKYD